MPENEMLEIMGKGYSKSSLINGRIKYSWRYNNGTSYSYKGLRSYFGVQKCDIFVKNGVVEEIKPFNL